MPTDPHLTGLPPRLTSITGCLMLLFLDNRQPVLLRRPGGREWLLPVFSTKEKLDAALAWMNIADAWKIQQITDQAEFLEPLAGHNIIVAADPYLHNGNTRWTGFIPDPSPNN